MTRKDGYNKYLDKLNNDLHKWKKIEWGGIMPESFTKPHIKDIKKEIIKIKKLQQQNQNN